MHDAYNLDMEHTNLANVVGALALALTDLVAQSVERTIDDAGPAAEAVCLVRHVPGIPIEQLRRALGMSHPGAVRLVERLEKLGLILRERSSVDRRAVELKLTQEGEALVSKMHQARLNALEEAIASLSSKDRLHLCRISNQILFSLTKTKDSALAICRLCDETNCLNCPVAKRYSELT
ncbi:MarR family transcriptional regulator [Scytonema sp. UIC 10036]|uniref:MarR family winged helix-turn-helix transcriptional regulator n=1 Tax=Scytonema sp. UIC 10036 TaxID=2304196 RepID=UPI001FAA01E3|nr:MarR family transcriptional regulator [Scytonema sp. UIC 10036]